MSFIWCNQCEYEERCSLRDIASDLTGCSGHSKLHHRFKEEKERLMREAEEKDKTTLLRNEDVMKQLKPGDKVKFVGNPKSYYECSGVPQYISSSVLPVGSVLTVLGFTRTGKVKCDYDGGNPFNIPPACLRIVKGD